MAESKLQSQMGSWDEGWGGECVGGWVRVKDVLSLFKGRISSQASVLLQRADMRMRKVGVIFLACCLFCCFFCYHPDPEKANYRDTRGTNKQINIWRHIHRQAKSENSQKHD